MPDVNKRTLVVKLVRICITFFVSIALGFIFQMAAYEYNFPTPGMFIASKMSLIPSQSKDWGPNLNFFFTALFGDSICCFVAIWFLFEKFKKISG